jgi:hypothetical protein
MSFLYPAFLIGGLAIAIPIVLHLLRREVAPDVPFTAVRLLRRSPVERTKRRRLRDVLLLAARMLAVLLLAAAFARPYVPTASGGGLRIVALDRSFSMTAPGRFAKALELARAAVSEAGVGERIAVLAFDERVDVLAEPGSAADARVALEGLSAGFGATRYRPAFEAALELARGGAGHLIVVTDLGRTGWEDDQPVTVPASLKVEIRDVGDAAENVAVTAVHREPDRIVATVRNAGATVYEGDVRIEADGRRLGQARVTAEPGASVDVAVSAQVPGTGALAVAIDDASGFAADNTRYLVLDPSAQPRVLIVTAVGPGRQSGFFLTRALEASSGGEHGLQSTTVAARALSALSSDQLTSYRAIALLSTRGLDRRGREAVGTYVRSGGGLFVAAAPDVEAALLSSALGWQPPLAPIELDERTLTLAATDLRHPIFRPFGSLAANLGQVRFDRVWRVRAEGWEVAARFADGTPALLERSEGSGRIVLFASDLDRRWNDFPLHPSFVPFAIESIRHVSGAREAAAAYTPATAPQEAGPRPGVFRLPSGRVVAVNVDPREGSTSRMTPAEFQDMIRQGGASVPLPPSSQATQTEASQSYWRYGLMLMLAALVGESLAGKSW